MWQRLRLAAYKQWWQGSRNPTLQSQLETLLINGLLRTIEHAKRCPEVQASFLSTTTTELSLCRSPLRMYVLNSSSCTGLPHKARIAVGRESGRREAKQQTCTHKDQQFLWGENRAKFTLSTMHPPKKGGDWLYAKGKKAICFHTSKLESSSTRLLFIHISSRKACPHQACWACDLRRQLILALSEPAVSSSN